MKLRILLGLTFMCMLLLFVTCSNVADKEAKVEVTFSKQVEVFGLHIYATNTTGDDKLLHAANILAEYIDNDEDGTPDNPKIMDALLERKGAIVVREVKVYMTKRQSLMQEPKANSTLHGKKSYIWFQTMAGQVRTLRCLVECLEPRFQMHWIKPEEDVLWRFRSNILMVPGLPTMTKHVIMIAATLNTFTGLLPQYLEPRIIPDV